MKKSFLAMLLSLSMAATLFTGCGDGAADVETGGKEEASKAETVDEETGENSEEAAEEGELVEIVFQLPLDDAPVGLQDVEDAFNAMVEPDLGVHVTFVTCPWADCPQEALLMISAGEQIDIVNSGTSDCTAFVDAEAIIPINDLLTEYGQAILEDLTPNALAGSAKNGVQYGVTKAYGEAANAVGMSMRKDLLEKYNIDYDYSKVFSLEEIGEIFGTIKAGEGENFYPLIAWNHGTAVALNSQAIPVMRIAGGEDYGAGVLMWNRSLKERTVVNFFETEEFEDICYTLYDWMQAGYFQPDAATTTMTPAALVADPNYAALPYGCNMVQDNADLNGLSDYEWVNLRLSDWYIPAGGANSGQWNITSSCENPEKAMQVLNYMYENPEATNLLQYGIEGQSWKVVDQAEEGPQIQIELLGVPGELPYYNPYGLFGCSMEMAVTAPTPMGLDAERAEHAKTVPDSKRAETSGFVFDSSSVKAELAAVSTVIQTYTPTLTTGSADPAVILPEFRAALKDAGIDTVIAESQRQLDDFFANK